METLLLAVWGAASVFVLWLALVSVVRRHPISFRKEASRVDPLPDRVVPEPTPEEILEAQALGLIHPARRD